MDSSEQPSRAKQESGLHIILDLCRRVDFESTMRGLLTRSLASNVGKTHLWMHLTDRITHYINQSTGGVDIEQLGEWLLALIAYRAADIPEDFLAISLLSDEDLADLEARLQPLRSEFGFDLQEANALNGEYEDNWLGITTRLSRVAYSSIWRLELSFKKVNGTDAFVEAPPADFLALTSLLLARLMDVEDDPQAVLGERIDEFREVSAEFESWLGHTDEGEKATSGGIRKATALTDLTT